MMKYSKEQIEDAYKKILELLKIVGELESTFEGRLFTMDGHLVGSIGEIMASYYYGIELYPPSAPTHDGITPDRREVQIKITQQSQVVISEEPDYLIVLRLDKTTGTISEVYNGPGKQPWDSAYIYQKRNTRYMMLNKLLELDKYVSDCDRISAINPIAKFEKKKIVHTSKMKASHVGKTLVAGYINKNNQENCGSTGKVGNHEGQIFYAMKCRDCGHTYEANGCDVWLRKCPNCM